MRHAIGIVVRDETLEELAFIRLARNNGRLSGLPGTENGRVIMHTVSAFCLLYVMAGEAFRKQNGRDIAAEIRSVNAANDSKKQENDARHSYSAVNAKIVLLLNG